MASAAEQLAANFNFGALSKATELKKRIWFTLGALVIYRLGTYIPDVDLRAKYYAIHIGCYYHATDDRSLSSLCRNEERRRIRS